MTATNSTMWFWNDWLGDQEVRRLTPAERGVWIDLLALAAAALPIGYVCDQKGRALTLEEIARVTNAGSPDEVSKLIAGILDKGAASRDRTGRLFNRRMVRDAAAHAKKAALADKRRKAGLLGADVTALRYFGKQILPRHGPQQPTRHMPRETLEVPSLKERLILSSSELRAREPVDKPQEATVEEIKKRIDELSASELVAARKAQA